MASAPGPIKLPGDALEDLARKWFDRWEAERTAGIASVESAAGVLKAAVVRARRGLSRRVEAMEAEAARRGGTVTRGRRATAAG